MVSTTTETRFPDDMIEEILYHLPVKSIFRFKCLSKKWLAKISDPRFVRLCRSRGGGSWGLFFQQTESVQSPLQFTLISHDSEVGPYSPPRLSLDFLPEPIVYVVASSNDLVLCSPTEVYQTLYYVCNPLTRQWVALPQSLSYKSVNISFSCVNDDYDKGSTFTVVRAIRDRFTSSFFEIEIFSSGSEEWTIGKVPYPCFPDRFFVLKGTLYWPDYGRLNIVAYNLIENQTHLIAFPGDAPDRPFNNLIHGCMGVFKEQLRYMEICNRRSSICVWVLEDSKKGEWCLEHSICFQSTVTQQPRIVEEGPSLIFYQADEFIDPPEVTDEEYPPIMDEFFYDDDFFIGPARIFIEPLAFHPLNRHIVVLRMEGSQILCYNFASKRVENVLRLSNDERISRSAVFLYLLSWPTRIPTPTPPCPPGGLRLQPPKEMPLLVTLLEDSCSVRNALGD